MKYSLLLFISIYLTSCKNEVTSPEQPQVNKEQLTSNKAISAENMWLDYTTEYPQFKGTEIPDAGYFHDNEKDALRLATLIANQKKQAGSGLYLWYKQANAPLPTAGTTSIVTDFNGNAMAITQLIKVDTIPFNQITPAYAALDMGSSEDALKKWKKAHRAFFVNSLKDSNHQFTDDMLVVCETFKTVWPR